MDEAREIKKLNSTIKELKEKADEYATDIKKRQKEHSKMLEEIKVLERRLATKSNLKQVKVSEHALLRYLERAKGLNIQEVEEEILNEKLVGMISSLGNGEFPHNGQQYVVKNNLIITIK